MRDGAVRADSDWAHRRIGLLLWGLPLIAILASAFGPLAPMTRGTIWALALLWAGAACITNACRSGRLHCYITGPFFVILGLASLLYGAASCRWAPRVGIGSGACSPSAPRCSSCCPSGSGGVTRSEENAADVVVPEGEQIRETLADPDVVRRSVRMTTARLFS